jgi:hypothetical protein
MRRRIFSAERIKCSLNAATRCLPRIAPLRESTAVAAAGGWCRERPRYLFTRSLSVIICLHLWVRTNSRSDAINVATRRWTRDDTTECDHAMRTEFNVRSICLSSASCAVRSLSGIDCLMRSIWSLDHPRQNSLPLMSTIIVVSV